MRSHLDGLEDDATMATNGDDVNGRLDRVEGRLERVEDRLERVEDRLERVEVKVDDLDRKVEGLDGKVEGLKIQFEQVREDIKKLGEGVDQGFKAIARQMRNLDRKWSDKWDTHDLALKDHGGRISALEQRK
jgi:archaellum component FlaC